MLTLFTTCKPFKDHIKHVQGNALKSWLQLIPRPEILVFGDESGVASACRHLKIHHIPEVEKSPWGVPLVSDMFRQAQKLAKNDLLCYTNADIILFQDILKASKLPRRRFEQFMMTGQRWDLAFYDPIDFTTNWQKQLRKHAKRRGKLHPGCGADYFMFRRGLYKNIPPFAVGRTAWDNWLIYDVIQRNIPTIDATAIVYDVHLGPPGGNPRQNKEWRYNQKLWRQHGVNHGGYVASCTWYIEARRVLRKRT